MSKYFRRIWPTFSKNEKSLLYVSNFHLFSPKENVKCDKPTKKTAESTRFEKKYNFGSF